MARPTKLTPEMITAAQEYIESCKDEYGHWEEHIDKDGMKHVKWVHQLKVKIPTIEGLAVRLNLSRSTVYEWSARLSKEDEAGMEPELIKLREEFSYIIENLLSLQAERLLDNGLSGTYNSTIAKVLLSGKHGYIEKKSTDITSGGDKIQTAPLIVSDIGSSKENNPTD